MSEAMFVVGDCLSTLRALPDSSVDLVLTSPPFLALRSYLPADDPAKRHEIGQEATPGAFLDVLLDITEELARVLTPHGSLCVELGDTYSGSGGAGGDYGEGGLREGQPKFRQGTPRWDGRPEGQVRTTTSDPAETMATRPSGGPGWPLAKSLCLIPESYRFALAYGRNPHTGRETDPWRVRNVVRWVRPNPPVGALGDKFRRATSEMVVACKSGARWFDLDAVRKMTERHARDVESGASKKHGQMGHDPSRNHNHGKDEYATAGNPNGAPPLDWWEIPTAPYKGSHYATYPPALCVRPVEAMCPREVCEVCGEPRRRITTEPTYFDGAGNEVEGKVWPSAMADRSANAGKTLFVEAEAEDGQADPTKAIHVETLGWSDCGHGAFRPGRVLDPFAGSGTTLQVATGHGRDALGIDLDRRNADLARERVGMWLTEATVDEAAAWLTAARPTPSEEDAA